MNVIAKTTEIKIDAKPTRKGNAKSVYCITDGNIYQSVADAAIAEGLHLSAISLVCRGKMKTANKKQWCFVNDLPNRILDISNNTLELKADAEKYRAIEAERKEKEEHEERIKKIQEQMKAREEEMKRLAEEYAKLTAQAV
jgi:hypothetical protein